MYGDGGLGRGSVATGAGEARAVGGFAGGAFGEALGVVAGFGGEAPEGELGGGEGNELGDVGDGEAEPYRRHRRRPHRSDRDRDLDRECRRWGR